MSVGVAEPIPATVRFPTTRFGEVTVRADEVLTFPEGIIGFEGIRRYVLLPNPGGGPFRWLQAVENPRVAFVVVDPRLVKADYQVPVSARDLLPIRVRDLAEGVVVVIVVVPRDPRHMTANLAGPVVLNLRERLGMQLVLTGPAYPARYPLFGSEGPEGEEVEGA